MKRHALFGLFCAMVAANSGCVPSADYYTVPWWKGAPMSVIAPSSLEAMAWQEQQQMRRRQHSSGEPSYVVDVPTDALRDAQQDQ